MNWKNEDVRQEVAKLLSEPVPFSTKEMCAKMLSLIDLTTLDGTDTFERVDKLCQKAKDYGTAAVCVYPFYASRVKQNLAGSGIRTACVAGGFPASQLPLKTKLFEIEQTLKDGADEIDMVISQGAFLEGDYDRVSKEVCFIKSLCGKATLKVILETGNLPTLDDVETASRIALDSGADFIKTSTGKTAVSATTEAFYVMLRVVAHYAAWGRHTIGIKPAGGISTVEEAIPYFILAYRILGEEWLNPSHFRIGASRLADALYTASR